MDETYYRFYTVAADFTDDASTGERVDGVGIFNNQRVHETVFRFGEPFSMTLTLGARVSSFLDQPGQAEVDAAHTQRWDGFLGVTCDQGGAVLYTTTSNSGADYSQPMAVVPEPSTWLLLGGSVLMLAIARRRLFRLGF